MSYRGYRRPGGYARPYRRTYGVARRSMGGSYGRPPMRRVVPRARALTRMPASLYGGRGATELKSVDSGAISLRIKSGGALNANVVLSLVMSPPLNGAAFYQRIGTRTRAKSLEIRGSIVPTNDNDAEVQNGFARILVVYDRQPNGALPIPGDILADYNAAGTTETSAFSGTNMNNRDRFLVLRDRKILLPGRGALGVAPTKPTEWCVDTNDDSSFVFKEFIKLKGLETHYKASAGGIGDIATGSFLIMGWSGSDTTANGAWKLVYGARFKFYD